MPVWLKRLTESYSQVKFGRGVVAKTGHVMLGVLGVWGLIVFRWSGQWSDAGLLIAGIVATGAALWWIRSSQQFAKENPAQAILEGTEFIEFSKFEAQAKGMPKLGDAPLVEGHPILLDDTGSHD
jgi:hypothetical protein